MLKNKIVFITGASSGIGRACAHTFANAGADLLLCSRRESLLKSLAQEITSTYRNRVYYFELDVCAQTKVAETINQLPAQWKEIDILINNAGLAAGLATVQEGEISDWEEMIDTNVKGLLYVTKTILPSMITRDQGHIVNLGSIAGHHVYPKGAVYCATKYAVNALSQGLRMDLFGTNIRVSSVDPGAVETNFSLTRFKGDVEKAEAVYTGMQPLSANDIAETILFCVTRPPHVNISEIIIMPTAQAAASMVYRKKETL